MIVGLLGFSFSFVGIGLAIVALSGGNLTCASYSAFGVAGICFIGTLIAFIYLVIHFKKIQEYVRQIKLYLQQGYKLREAILNVKGSTASLPPGLNKKLSLWQKAVQKWLDCYLPEHASDFQLETVTSTTGWFTYEDLSKDVCNAALLLDSKLVNLREILRDIRR